jgi:ribonuclease VapC
VIVIDTSALVAILLQEPPALAVSRRIEDAGSAAISAGTLAECSVVSHRRSFAEDMRALLADIAPEIVAVDAAATRRIDAAFARFGRGNHPAGLNFGDLFAYDAAISRGAPLLYVGEDFARTDVRPALH